jgi:addiction module RelB/DinJ family antitoxin
MNTMITVRTDVKLKKKAQKLAASLGIPISSVINNSLKEFVREKRVVFSEPLVPNAATQKRLDKAMKDIEQGKNLVGPFTNAKDFIASLNS